MATQPMHGEHGTAKGARAGHLQLLPGAAGAPRGARRPLVVFIGVGDDRRSSIAAALLEHRAKGRVQGVSMSPATVRPDPVVVRSLGGLGVDLRAQRSSPLSRELLERATVVVLMGYTPDELAARTEDWYIDDPSGKDPQTVRYLLDAIDRRVQRLLRRLASDSGSEPEDAPA